MAKWTRRRFLQAAGIGCGGAALLPFLPTLTAQASTGPKRLVLITHGNGVEMPGWRPTGGETDFTLSYSLEPFAPYRSELLILDGVDNEAIADRERRGTGHDGMSTLWTGAELPAGEFGDKNTGWPQRPSIDHIIGEYYASETPFSAYYQGMKGTGPNAEGPQDVAHHRGADQPIRTQNHPAVVFDAMFAGVIGGDTDAGDRLRARKQSVLDLVRGEISRVRAQLPTSDRERMDAHLAGVEVLERRIAGLEDRAVCQVPERPREFTYREQDHRNQALITELHFELMSHALTCDLTRVSCFQWGGEGSNGTGEFLTAEGYEGFSAGIHTTSHEMTYSSNGTGGTDEERSTARSRMRELTRWRSEKIVTHLLDRLPASVRENTLLVWGSAMCEGGSHSNRNVPLVMVQGSEFDHFRTGRYLQWGDFDPLNANNGFNQYSGGVPNNRVLTSICQAMGLEHIDHVGEPDIEGSALEVLR